MTGTTEPGCARNCSGSKLPAQVLSEGSKTAPMQEELRKAAELPRLQRPGTDSDRPKQVKPKANIERSKFMELWSVDVLLICKRLNATSAKLIHDKPCGDVKLLG